MIKLYKSKRAVPAGQEIIEDVDRWFNALYSSGRLSINNSDIEIMQRVDDVLAYSNGYMKTKYGDRVPITYLSTGCKTCLIANHLSPNYTLSIEQCGANALTEIFKMDERRYLLSFCCLPENTKLVHPVSINSGKKVCHNTYELRGVWDK